MSEIEKEDLLKHLQKSQDSPSTLDMEAFDFVLLKLNEIKYEVSLKLKEKERRIVDKNVS